MRTMEKCHGKFMVAASGGRYNRSVYKENGMSFQKNLVQLRAREGMTQEELAEIMGVSRSTIAKWEGGSGIPRIDNVIRLSRLFQVTIDELLQGQIREEGKEYSRAERK